MNRVPCIRRAGCLVRVEVAQTGSMRRSRLQILGVQEGDYRDWDAIRAWAKDTQLKLNLAPK